MGQEGFVSIPIFQVLVFWPPMKVIVSSPSTLEGIMQQGCPGSSKNTLREWLREERILINGKPAKPRTPLDTPLQPGVCVTLGPRKKFGPKGLEILYEDRDLVVIDKPAGLLSVATDHQKESSVHAILKQRYHTRRVFPVHRLDRDTSGILVFAYTEEARDHLKKQFEVHSIEREYCALVQGAPTPAQGSWRSYLIEEKNFYVRSTGSERGRLAITHYSVIKSNRTFTLLQLKLETGRKNQIRVQAKEAGCPILGDEKYNPSLTEEEHRLCLHATRLAFQHPTRQKTLTYTSPPPAFFQKLVK